MIDLMVLAKSLSSLTGTQMINKLDHAKRGEKEQRGERGKKKRGQERERMRRRKGERQNTKGGRKTE